jgi:cytochrome c oxidase subunit 6b
MSAANVDPHNKMRARDVNRVARVEQAPRPAHEYGTVSPSPSHPTNNNNDTESKDTTKDDDQVFFISFIIVFRITKLIG